MEMIEEGFDPYDAEKLEGLSEDVFDVEVDFTNLEENGKTYDNYFVMIMESIYY